jgi:hypothetical protein
MLKVGVRVKSMDILQVAAEVCKTHNIALSSDFARTICTGLGMSMSHTLLPYVVDWWGIRDW